ncbi:MAG: hypothetical protein SWH61_12430 [Thermodesulfobacteriota bacterium]|nr:hypothetical protein [Thermodesulfobacteriota bacterium]
MKWAEIITVRARGNHSKILVPTTRKLLNDLINEVGRDCVRIYNREGLETDIYIVLFHNGEKKSSGGSPLGLRLVNAFQEFGLVHHTVWIEMDHK